MRGVIAEKRYELILDIVYRQSSATVQQLAQDLDTSESTIRRDLLTLDQQGKLRRVHGGAAALEGRFLSQEPDMATKEGLYVREKQSIGRYGATLIEGDDFVYIDAGTTTLELVKAISGDALRATYMTNGLAHTRVLARKGCRVYVPAGRVKATTEAIVGTRVLSCLSRYNFTKAFIGVNGISLDRGFTTPGIEEAELKAEAIRSAYQSWFLADSSKFGKTYAAGICELRRCPVITERLPNEVYREHTTVKETEL